MCRRTRFATEILGGRGRARAAYMIVGLAALGVMNLGVADVAVILSIPWSDAPRSVQ